MGCGASTPTPTDSRPAEEIGIERCCKPDYWQQFSGAAILNMKELKDEHVDALIAALTKYQVHNVILDTNKFGPKCAAKLAEALKTNTTLKSL